MPEQNSSAVGHRRAQAGLKRCTHRCSSCRQFGDVGKGRQEDAVVADLCHYVECGAELQRLAVIGGALGYGEDGLLFLQREDTRCADPIHIRGGVQAFVQGLDLRG